MGKANLLFSIILPVYNSEGSLKRTLQSVQSQTCSNFELCAVNDGSSDQSGQVLKEFQSTASFKVKLVEQKNAGVAAARNRAVDVAEAKWLVFLDADDIWSAKKLELLEDAISHQPEIDFWTHGMIRKSQSQSRKAFPPDDLSAKELLLHGNQIITSSAAVKRDGFLEIGGMVEDRSISSAEDWDCWVQLLNRGVQYRVIEQILGEYSDQEGGLSKDLDNHRSACFNVLEKYRNNKLLSEVEWQEATRQKSYEMARKAHKLKDYERAVNWYQDSVPTGKRKMLELLARFRIAV